MRRLFILAAPLLLIAACSGDDDTTTDEPAGDDEASEPADEPAQPPADEPGDDESDEPAGPPADLPTACTAAPVEIDFTMSALPEYPGPFTAQSAIGQATPIVPNGDGSLDDLDISGFNALGAETDLLMYTQWVGDHPFDFDDLGFISGPEAPAGSVTLGLTVVPTSATGLAAGDLISSGDEFEFDSITTFGSVGLFFQPDEGVETYFLVNNLDETQGGTAEVLYVDDEWLCIDWSLAGETRDPEGTYSMSGVLLTQLERQVTPFT
jgi:hypothetical protein